jgi:hypothetical protein
MSVSGWQARRKIFVTEYELGHLERFGLDAGGLPL